LRKFVKILTMTDATKTMKSSDQEQPNEENPKILELEKQLQEAEQTKLRALADLENFKRREGEARARWSQDATADWVRNLLPSLQELLLGAEHTKDEDIKKVIEKFMNRLTEQGLTQIAPQPGEEINPDEQVVLMAAEGAPGTVVQLLERGWKLKETVILPAKISGAPVS
jgi:molecular chaperone GrpE